MRWVVPQNIPDSRVKREVQAVEEKFERRVSCLAGCSPLLDMAVGVWKKRGFFKLGRCGLDKTVELQEMGMELGGVQYSSDFWERMMKFGTCGWRFWELWCLVLLESFYQGFRIMLGW